MKTNILVEYVGGGYSGCIWEYNYFYIDENSKFHDIMSSGHGGITTQAEANNLLTNGHNDWTDADQVSIYHLDNKDELTVFAKETACPNIQHIILWFNEYNSPIAEPFAICSKCDNELTNADEIQLTDFRGCGGIMTTADTLLCYECYSSGMCGCCNEYVSSDDLVYLDNEGKWNKGSDRFEEEYKNKAAISMLEDGLDDVCTECIKSRAGEIERDEHEDMLFQSLATGKPDMFSDEMRWFWT